MCQMQSKYINTEMAKYISRVAMNFMPCMLSKKQPHTVNTINCVAVWMRWRRVNFLILRVAGFVTKSNGPNPFENLVVNIIPIGRVAVRIKIVHARWGAKIIDIYSAHLAHFARHPIRDKYKIFRLH